MQKKPDKKPGRILCVFSTLDRGGAETMCMNLYRHIDRDEIQFDFVKHTSEIGAYEKEIEEMGGHIYQAPRYRFYNHFSYCRWWRRHLKQHPEHRIIHGHYFTIAAVYFKVAKKCRRITVGHSHCAQPDNKSGKGHLLKLICKRMERYSDVRLACSKVAGEWIYNKEFIVLNNAIEVNQFAYDPEIREQVRRQLNLENRFVIGTVGRIMHQKNPDGVVDIFRAVFSKRQDAFLLWVGDGPMKKEMEKKVAELGLEEQVLFTGVRSDVSRLLQAMDAFILPSFYEGLPVVAIEAQAAGLPCYISDQVSAEVNVTENSRLLPLHDTDKWTECLCSAQPDRKDQRNTLIDAGYDIQYTSQWLRDFYKALLLLMKGIV